MLTAIAATLLTITTATPAATTPSTANLNAFSKTGTTTLATALPTPGAWALMGMGGLALIRSRRDKR